MFRHSFQPKIFLKNSTAALLAITLSGAFYLFCCQVMKAAEKGEHCPISKPVRSDHCNFSERPRETPPMAASINLFECCQLKFSFFVAKLEKNEFPQAAPARVNGFFRLPESTKLAATAKLTDSSYRVPVFDSRELHIKNCVFRI